MHFRILKIIVNSEFLAALECTKFVFGRGYDPDPVVGAYIQLSPDPLAGLGGPTSKGTGGEGKERNRRGRGKGREGKGRK